MRLFVGSSGKPSRLVRRVLFHASGRPRSILKRIVLNKDGLPRAFFRDWMNGSEYQSMPGAVRLHGHGVANNVDLYTVVYPSELSSRAASIKKQLEYIRKSVGSQ